MKPAVERLLDRVSIDAESGCWLVPPSSKPGYAQISVDGSRDELQP